MAWIDLLKIIYWFNLPTIYFPFHQRKLILLSFSKYISNGKYNRIAASATDSEQGAFKYGRINYPAIENYLKTNKVLSNSEKNAIGDIIK